MSRRGSVPGSKPSLLRAAHRHALFVTVLLLSTVAGQAQTHYYNTANTTSSGVFGSENWIQAVDPSGTRRKKWVTSSATTTYTDATAGNYYHTNGFSIRAGRIGSPSGGLYNPFVFTGASLILDSHDPASNVSDTGSTAGSEIYFNLQSSASFSNLATYQADIVVAATAPGVMRNIRSDTGQTTLQGTLTLNGDLQLLSTNSSTSQMTFTIASTVTGSGNILITGGSTGGSIAAGALKWTFASLGGWTGNSITVQGKNTISFSNAINFSSVNPNASLSLASTAFLDLAANIGFSDEMVTRNGVKLPSGTYTVSDLNTLWGAGTVTGTGSLYIAPPVLSQPAITTQPVAQATWPGAEITFTVAGTGGGLTYQWYRNGVAISGATSSTFKILDAEAPDDANYYAILTNSVGSAQSNTVSLIVDNPPPSFPGAEGAGALSIGGRGGRVIQVTTLDDYAANESVIYGSLRAALAGLVSPTVTDTGPKIIVFTVGGTIQLKRGLIVDQPYLTVAGQTAPGGGIQLKCSTTTPDSVLTIMAHDVIWRYTKFRRGYYPDPLASRHQTIVIVNGGYNIMLDHNTIMWSMDEGLGIWSETSAAGLPPHNITTSWSLIAEQLRVHSTQNLIGANSTANADRMTEISAVKNYMANSNHRNPQFKGKSGSYVSNLMYNARRYQMQASKGAVLDVISNYYKQPSYNPLTDTHEFDFYPDPDAYSLGITHQLPSGDASYYVVGNIGQHNPDGSLDNWTSMVRRINDQNLESTYPYNPSGPAPQNNPDPLYRGGPEGVGESTLDTYWKRSPAAPRPVVGYPFVVFPASTLPTQLLMSAGASHRLDAYGEWVYNRDTTDERVVMNFLEGTGYVPVTENDTTPQSGTSGPAIGGYPTIAAGLAYADLDADGMSDAWETIHSVSDPQADPDSDGYTNIEEFINGTSPTVANVVDSTPPVLTLPSSPVVEATSASGATVTFSASATDNVDGTVAVTFSHASGSTFPLGTTDVEATAKDANGNIVRGWFTVTVEDTTAPAFASLTASPNVLSPPNSHSMVAVTITPSVSDLVDSTPVSQIISVSSNEALTGTGDGDVSPDWEITGALTLNLRAERSGYGTGRVYTITVESRDDEDNVSTDQVTVTAPVGGS